MRAGTTENVKSTMVAMHQRVYVIQVTPSLLPIPWDFYGGIIPFTLGKLFDTRKHRMIAEAAPEIQSEVFQKVEGKFHLLSFNPV